MLKLTPLFSLFVFLAVFFFICAIHSAWITATPGTLNELRTAQIWFNFYVTLVGAAILCAIGTIVWMIRRHKRLN
jgi:hypothetical protein